MQKVIFCKIKNNFLTEIFVFLQRNYLQHKFWKFLLQKGYVRVVLVQT